jgi:hypothetical protein
VHGREKTVYGPAADLNDGVEVARECTSHGEILLTQISGREKARLADDFARVIEQHARNVAADQIVRE